MFNGILPLGICGADTLVAGWVYIRNCHAITPCSSAKTYLIHSFLFWPFLWIDVGLLPRFLLVTAAFDRWISTFFGIISFFSSLFFYQKPHLTHSAGEIMWNPPISCLNHVQSPFVSSDMHPTKIPNSAHPHPQLQRSPSFCSFSKRSSRAVRARRRIRSKRTPSS